MPRKLKSMPRGFGKQEFVAGGPKFQITGQLVVNPANLDVVLEKMGTDAIKKVYQVLLTNAIRMQQHIQAEMRKGQHTGEIYTWKVDLSMYDDPDLWVGPFPNGWILPARLRTRPHRASAEGEYPARDSGKLARSIIVRQWRTQNAVTVGTREVYGRFLNEGAERANIKPRPFIEPTAQKYIPLILRDVEDALAAAVAGRSGLKP